MKFTRSNNNNNLMMISLKFWNDDDSTWARFSNRSAWTRGEGRGDDRSAVVATIGTYEMKR